MPGMPHQSKHPTHIDGQVDHFPEVLKHFDDGRLIETTRKYMHMAFDGPKAAWDNSLERAKMCKAECNRRHLSVSRGAVSRGVRRLRHAS